MEASTGIEPVYTDLQSKCFPNDANGLAVNLYQDTSRTLCEPDTTDSGRISVNVAASAVHLVEVLA